MSRYYRALPVQRARFFHRPCDFTTPKRNLCALCGRIPSRRAHGGRRISPQRHGENQDLQGEKGLLERLSALLRARKFGLCSWQLLEDGRICNSKSLATTRTRRRACQLSPKKPSCSLCLRGEFPPNRFWRPCQFRCSSSMCARMIASKLVSASKPSEHARDASRLRGHPSTIRMMTGSGWRRMSFTRSAPAHRPRLSIISLTVAERPGIERFLRAPTSAPSISAARKKNPTAEPGDANQCRIVSGTGSTAS